MHQESYSQHPPGPVGRADELPAAVVLVPAAAVPGVAVDVGAKVKFTGIAEDVAPEDIVIGVAAEVEPDACAE